MKKVVSVVLALVLVLSFAACSKKEKQINAQASVDALLATEDFKNAKKVDADDVELEYDITLEDTSEFFMYEDVNTKNMFIVAIAKDSKSTKLMYDELTKVENAYADSITKSTYADIQQFAPKVEKRYVSKEMNAYICIISEDSTASSGKIVIEEK